MDENNDINFLDRIEAGSDIRLSIESLARGIDNYHVDIKLSRRFCGSVRKIATLLISQQAVPKPKQWDNTSLFEKMRKNYQDVLTVLMHRVKTDLSADEVCFMQFATMKYILTFVRQQLDEEIRGVSSRLTELRNKGSSEALAVDQRLFWLKRNRDKIQYNVNRMLFNQLQRVEERQLAVEREQHLGPDYQFTVQAMFNPMLWVSELSALPLLLNEYCMWSWNAEDSAFITLNQQLEELFASKLPEVPILALRKELQDQEQPEIHDELGGLLQTQAFLGKPADSKNVLEESMSWFEIPENVERLFNIERLEDELEENKKALGFSGGRKVKAQIKTLTGILKSFSKILQTNKVLPQLLASHYMRRSLHPTIVEIVDLKVVCQYLAGAIPIEKLKENVIGGSTLSSQQETSLIELREKISTQIARADNSDMLKLLVDFSRYRQHLKLCRLAHRAFNRLILLRNEEDLKLSKTAGTLYSMPTASEIEEEEERICHHAIMKADVRGSTTVTDELQAKGLNPASYFSMRFFNPINKILETYGANKVFIEGDALILSFLEYENTPQQWYAVSRACGYARDMLKIVSSNNRYSTQMGLPLLELGVGICFSDEAPRFLYDEDKPIMISGAIGLADRMSSCSWNLRAALGKTIFNVDVLRLAEGEASKGEKGQHFLRYNVNGILLDDVAFAKLKAEMHMKTVKMKLNGEEYTFHVGQYPDTAGRKKDLVVRQGNIGTWRNGEIDPHREEDDFYYEVVVNRKVLPLVLEKVQGKKAASVS